MVRGQGEENEESDVATIMQLFGREDFFLQVEERCYWEEMPPGEHVGTIVTDNGPAELVYLLENLENPGWVF